MKTPAEITYRLAEKGDDEELRQFINEHGPNPDFRVSVSGHVRKHFFEPAGHYAVVAVSGRDEKIIGVATAIMGAKELVGASRRPERLVELGHVLVHPDYRHQGIARKLTEERIRHGVNAHGATAFAVRVATDPKAFGAYQKLGFVVEVRERGERWLVREEKPAKG